MGEVRPKAKWERRRETQQSFDVFAALARLNEEKASVECWVGSCQENAKPAHNPCCSSHGKPLCCKCYKRLHFVETGPPVCH